MKRAIIEIQLVIIIIFAYWVNFCFIADVLNLTSTPCEDIVKAFILGIGFEEQD